MHVIQRPTHTLMIASQVYFDHHLIVHPHTHRIIPPYPITYLSHPPMSNQVQRLFFYGPARPSGPLSPVPSPFHLPLPYKYLPSPSLLLFRTNPLHKFPLATSSSWLHLLRFSHTFLLTASSRPLAPQRPSLFEQTMLVYPLSSLPASKILLTKTS